MTQRARKFRGKRGFSIVEMLVALAISASLLTATLQALDASWKSYKQVTEAASTHVVARIVVYRLLAMFRTGSQFGPAPADVLDNTQNPLTSTYVEFVSESDQQANNGHITRIERRDSSTTTGQYELWYVLTDASGTLIEQHPLLTNVKEVNFELQYDVGPRLTRATIDLAVEPTDDKDLQVGIWSDPPPLRLVASVVPRQLQ